MLFAILFALFYFAYIGSFLLAKSVHPKALRLRKRENFDCTHCFAMASVNLLHAGDHLGFRSTTTLLRLLAGQLSAYLCSGRDLSATCLEVAQKGRPTLRQHVNAHTECLGNSALWDADYEGWPVAQAPVQARIAQARSYTAYPVTLP